MGSVQEQGLSNVAEAIDYAHQVVAKKIPACKWVKAACQRQLDDLAQWESDPDYPFDWRPDLAEHEINFLQRLHHVKGALAGELLLLEPWQKFTESCLFGWVRKDDGYRRFRTAYEEVPRKNAKTTKLAGRGLYLLVADNEFGAEVYSAATTKEQARIVFRIAQQMARMDGGLRARFGLQVFARSLVVPDSDSSFTPLSADGQTLDGLNVSAALVDEVHAHKTREVYDALDTGTGARTQPLISLITTSGSNRAGVGYDLRGYACKILNTVLKRHGGMGYPVKGHALEDDSFFAIIYTIDDDDDVMAEATWAKANPNYGVSVSIENMRRMATKARASAAALSQFKTKHLDVWVNAASGWMNMLKWDACEKEILREQFKGMPCVIGLDAAFKKDLFAKVQTFSRDGKLYVFGRYYLPQAVVEADGNEQLAAWAHDGWIRTTPGEVLDIEAVREELLADTKDFEVTEIPFDPAQLTQFAGEMLEKGLPMVDMRPTVMNFSPAMKEVDELVTAGKLVQNGDPVLAWAIANVVCYQDNKDNIYPRKERVDDKIDPAIALFMSVARQIAVTVKEPEPGIIVL